MLQKVQIFNFSDLDDKIVIKSLIATYLELIGKNHPLISNIQFLDLYNFLGVIQVSVRDFNKISTRLQIMQV